MGKKSFRKALKKGDTSIRVTDDSIKTLNNVNFDELKDLKGITFLRCRIEDVGNEIMKVHMLESLSLAENDIREVPTTINALKFLVFINLSMNKISKLSGNLFNTMKNLTVLDLSFNRLCNASDVSVISTLTSLKALYLSDNKFIDIGADIGNLVNLEVLSLRGNGIATLPNAIGANLTNLKELYVQDNKLTYLPPNLANTNISPNGKLLAYNNPWKIEDLDASLKKPIILLFNYFNSEAYKNNVNALVMNGFNIFE